MLHLNHVQWHSFISGKSERWMTSRGFNAAAMLQEEITGTLKTGNGCAGNLLLQEGELACSAKVHFPGNTGLQAAAVKAAVQDTPCGPGRLLLACGRLAELAEAKTGAATALSGSAATSGACNSEAADETAPLNVFSNPLYTCATPKQIC